MANQAPKTKASKIIESLTSMFNESTVTAQTDPDFDKMKNFVTTTGTVIPMPHMPYISTVNFGGGHTATLMDGSHTQAPNGMDDSLTSTPDGIEHIKSMMGKVGGDDGNGNTNQS